MSQLVIFGRLARPGVAALANGAKALGMRAVVTRPQFEARSGLIANVGAVFLDGLAGDNTAILTAYRAAGIPCYVMDLPRLRAASDSWGIFQNTLHDLPTRLGNEALVFGVIPDRVPAFVLVVGQKPGDAAHGMTAQQCARWAWETVAVAQSQYGYPVRYRAHPKDTWSDLAEMYGADERSDASVPIREEFAECAGVITYNSTAGIEAIDAGVPVLYTAPPELVCYAQYAERLGSLFPMLSPEQRVTCLLRVSATQWTPEQLNNGTALQCLLNGATWPEPRETVIASSADDGTGPEVFTPSVEGMPAAASSATLMHADSKPKAITSRKRHGN